MIKIIIIHLVAHAEQKACVKMVLAEIKKK